MLPYCDGDVSDLQGIHFYDDARYNVPGDDAPKHSITVMGANHNFYNTIWTPGMFPAGTADDGLFVGDPFCDTAGERSGRLLAAEQRGTLLAYMSAFFRVYLGGETQFMPYLTGDEPSPPSAQTDELLVSYHAADNPSTRRDVNRFLRNRDLSTNYLGGAVTRHNLTPQDLCGGDGLRPEHCLDTFTFRQPHTTPSFLSSMRGLSQFRTGWVAGPNGKLVHNIPSGPFRDVTGFGALQFRAGVNFESAQNPASRAQDFSVRLVTGGGSAVVRVSDFSDALLYPPGANGPVPKLLLHTVRVPLAAFAGVDLTDVRKLQIVFDETRQGAVMLTDLAFAD
jgi:hypothetical protein